MRPSKWAGDGRQGRDLGASDAFHRDSLRRRLCDGPSWSSYGFCTQCLVVQIISDSILSFCSLHPYHQLNMASRRLAISSLLCSDETNPPSSSPTSSPTSARTLAAHDSRPTDRPSRHHPAFPAQTSNAHPPISPSYRPLSDAKYTPAVDRPRSYNDSDGFRSRPATYSPQFVYRREPSTSPERVLAQHQHQQTYTSPMSPYNTQPPTQSSPWSGQSPLYARPSTSGSQDNYLPLTRSPVQPRSRSFSNSSMHLTQYPPQSTPTYPPYNSSPVLPQPSPSLGGGLEALAQAASQERRRLGNEFTGSRRTASRESITRTPAVVQHPTTSPSAYEYTREPAPTWRRRSQEHHEPPHKRRKSYDLLDEPIPAEPLEIFQPARPPLERSSLMRISALVPELSASPERTYAPPKPQRLPTLPRVSDVRHSVSTGPTIPIADLLTNDPPPPPRRISPPPLPPPPSLPPLQILPLPIVRKTPTPPPPRSPTPPPRSASPVNEPSKSPTEYREPHHSPETPILPDPDGPVTSLSPEVQSPSPMVEGAIEVEVDETYNVPTLATPVQESSEPPTPSPVIPVEMHPSLSPSPVDDQPPTPIRSPSPMVELEPKPESIPEPPIAQVCEPVPESELEPELEVEPEPAPVSVPDVEEEPAVPPKIEPPRHISIISVSTPLPPPPYSSPTFPISGPGLRPLSPIRTFSYSPPRDPPAQSEPEPDHDTEARNDDDGTESDNMTVDMEFDLAAGVTGDNAVGGGGTRTDSEYDMEVDDELLRLVSGDNIGTVHGGNGPGHTDTSRYKGKSQAASTPTDAFFNNAVPPPMDLEKIMREQVQPRVLYQQLQGPGQPLVPLIVHEPPPEPKPVPKPAMKGKKKQTIKVSGPGISRF